MCGAGHVWPERANLYLHDMKFVTSLLMMLSLTCLRKTAAWLDRISLRLPL